MKWHEFKCRNCKKILNKKKHKVITETREYFCRECSKVECVDCRLFVFINPKNIAKCKRCKIKENKKIRQIFPSINCVYLLYSKKLNVFKIGETNSVTTRLSRVKYEHYPSSDWEIVDMFPYTNKKLLEKILHSRLSNFKIGDNNIDYFEKLHFMLEPKYFIRECEFCIGYLRPFRRNI